MVVGNHFSFVDPIAVVCIAPWPLEFLGGAHPPHAPKATLFIPKLWGYLPLYRGTGAADAIKIAAAVLKQDGVLGIFPEGGNWTPRRWKNAIEGLERRGQYDRAVRAAKMPHVLPPRSSGAVAALQARDDVAVVFVAHVGLEDLYSLRRIWESVPLRRRVQAAYWSVPNHEIPTDQDALRAWLLDRWVDVDTWVDEHQAEAFEKRS